MTDIFRKATVLFVVWSLFAIGALSARDVSVLVEDADLAMPLDGATVRLQDGTQFTCGEDGLARFQVPDDKDAVLVIAYPGYETARLVVGAAGGRTQYRAALRLEGMLSNKELVFTAERPQSRVSAESGRSVTLAGKELARVAEIGFMEDVMTAIKLLPGVGYTSMFNAMPSIRGGDPGDLMASLDGFYIEFPYFWGGSVSIFDPHMIESVKLSHGIFSARYGHTISGLLELHSKKPSATETEIEFGVSTSAVNLNVSIPINEKGGLIVMGKTTYWDGYIALVKALSYAVELLEPVRAVTTAPYMRVAQISGGYAFSDKLETTLNGFIGGDGVGAAYSNPLTINGRTSNIDLHFEWANLQGFLTNTWSYYPSSSSAVKTTVGGGFLTNYIDGDLNDKLRLRYSDEFKRYMEGYGYTLPSTYDINQQTKIKTDNSTYTAQGRVDYDWEGGHGLSFGAGAEAFYTRWTRSTAYSGTVDVLLRSNLYPFDRNVYINAPVERTVDGLNQALTSAAFTTLQYKNKDDKFGAELGLRLDHLYFMGRDFSIQTYPAFNPRLNLDYRLLQGKGPVDALSLTAGTGLFSSMTDNVSNLQGSNGIGDFDLKQNRSWTSLVGIKTDFLSNYSFNIEGYYKYVFDRAYTVTEVGLDPNQASQTSKLDYHFDGEGHVWGFDMMLQKYHSQYVDGWIAYTFNYALYRNPTSVDPTGKIVAGDWRFPTFHRFHNLNIVLNIKPSKRFNISARIGYASGTPLTEPGAIEWYPVLVQRPGETPYFIQKYKRINSYSDTRRNGFSLPLDLKFSFFSFNKSGKTQGETYVAIENALAFVKTRDSNTSFNAYTGTEVEGSDVASYQMPIPMISFGFTWTY
ncbi:MAG: TonB-dependent receptor plug domain-containing protein [Spirochaetaceae bacterium]|jgi:hypothetical protein|nr:TonB-dependent receptor plug domain-containing protein [Spirochaetaceae bacterium]